MNLLSSTSIFSFFTLLSRVLGYLRDFFIAIFLGASIFADAFFVAFRLPNTFRRLFAEGTFNAAFVPSYTSEKLESKKKGQILIKTPFQIDSINDGEKLKTMSIRDESGKIEQIEVDFILAFLGLIMQLGPISEWGLNMNKKTISVNTENFQTNKKGIFAIGDICSYPGKEKLILSGFHEAALASVECFKRARPNEKYRFQFTTSSKEIQERLGRKPK